MITIPVPDFGVIFAAASVIFAVIVSIELLYKARDFLSDRSERNRMDAARDNLRRTRYRDDIDPLS